MTAPGMETAHGSDGPLRLRPARLDDAERLFCWRCDPATSMASFGPPPTWEEHVGWLNRRLGDLHCDLRILEFEERPAGTVRLDRCVRRSWGRLCEVSIAIAPDCRGRGLGKAALALARELKPVAPLVARVKRGNIASRRLFLSAGYQPFSPGVFVHWPVGAAVAVGAAAE